MPHYLQNKVLNSKIQQILKRDAEGYSSQNRIKKKAKILAGNKENKNILFILISIDCMQNWIDHLFIKTSIIIIKITNSLA